MITVKKAMEDHLKLMAGAMRVATDHATTVVLEEMHRETSLTDHSLTQLRQLGHPYRQGATQGNPHPDWLVHYQSGSLQAGLSRGGVREGAGFVEADISSNSPHTWYLLLGTRRMRPRDFVSASLINSEKPVAAIFEYYVKSIMDKKGSGHSLPQTTLIPNDRYAPQLPRIK